MFQKHYGKCKKRANIIIITYLEPRQKNVKKPNFRSEIIFRDTFLIARMAKSKNKIRQTYFHWVCYLELFKLLMYQFHWEYMKPKYGDATDLWYMGTDCLIYDVRTEEFQDKT